MPDQYHVINCQLMMETSIVGDSRSFSDKFGKAVTISVHRRKFVESTRTRQFRFRIQSLTWRAIW